MEMLKVGMAGTMESSDIMITLEPNMGKDIELYLDSSVEKQFGNQIRKVILETLQSLDIHHGIVRANDKGALDCVIRARVQAAALRASEGGHFNWREVDQ